MGGGLERGCLGGWREALDQLLKSAWTKEANIDNGI